MTFTGLVTKKQNGAYSTNFCNITRPRKWRKRGGWCYLFTTKWILRILRVGWMGPRRGTASNGEGLSCKTESQPSVAVVQLAPTTYIWVIYLRHISKTCVGDIHMYMGDIYLSCRTESQPSVAVVQQLLLNPATLTHIWLSRSPPQDSPDPQSFSIS